MKTREDRGHASASIIMTTTMITRTVTAILTIAGMITTIMATIIVTTTRSQRGDRLV
jgi:hypothetical protein